MDFLSVSKEWDPLDSLYISGGVLSGVQLNFKERRGGRGCWSIFQFRRGGAPLGSLPLSVWDGVPLEFLSIEKGGRVLWISFQFRRGEEEFRCSSFQFQGEGPLDFLSSGSPPFSFEIERKSRVLSRGTPFPL